MCFLGCLHPLKAQTTVTIGDLSTKNAACPFDMYNSYGICQILCTSDELGIDGNVDITSFGAYFYGVTNGSLELMEGVEDVARNFKVYLQSTTINELTGYQSLNNAKLCYSGSKTLINDGLTTFDFEESFSVNTNESPNLLVTFVDNTGYTAGNNWYTWYVHEKNSSCLIGSPSSFNENESYSLNVNTLRPTVSFTYEASGPQPLSCKATANGNETTTAYIGNNVSLEAEAKGGTGNYTYNWTGDATLTNATNATATFTPEALGTYTFTCTVNDGETTVTSNTVIVNVTEKPESNIDLTKQYRIKVNDGNYAGNYLHINSFNSPTRDSQVGIASLQDSNAQIFTIEESGDGNYYLKSADGYYIKCNDGNDDGNWSVAAYSTTDKTPLTFEDVDGTSFYIRDYDKYAGNNNQSATSNNYFKVQNYLLYCDAAITMQNSYEYVCTWTLEEYVPVDHSNDCKIVFTIGDSFGDGNTNNGLTISYGGQSEQITVGSPSDVDGDVNGNLYKDIEIHEKWIPQGSEVTISFFGSNYLSEMFCCIAYENGDVIKEFWQSGGGVINTGTSCTFTVDCSVAAFQVELTADNTSVCEGDAVQLTATASEGSGNYTYTWSPADGLSATNVADPVFTPTEAGQYTLTCTVTDADGNTDSETISITVTDYEEISPIVEYVDYVEGGTSEVTISLDDLGLPNYIYFNVEPYDGVSWNGNDVTLTVSETSRFTLTAQTYGWMCPSTTTIDVIVTGKPAEPETIVVDGDGYDNSWYNNNNYLPTNTYYNYTLSQQIYTKEEIGLEAQSQITSIYFKTYEISNEVYSRNLSVYVVNTEKSSFDSTEDYVAMQQDALYSGTVTFADEEWSQIEFAEPFVYEGDNLLVCVVDNTGTCPGSNKYYVYPTTSVQSIVQFNDNAVYDATNPGSNSYQNSQNVSNDAGNVKNQLQITYVPYEGSEILKAEILADNTELCDGDNENKFTLTAERVKDATYEWYNGTTLVGAGETIVYSNANPDTYTIRLEVTQNGVVETTTVDLTIKPLPSAMFDVENVYLGEPTPFAITDPVDGASYEFTIADPDGVPYSILSSTGEVTFEVTGQGYAYVTATLNGCTQVSPTVYFEIYPTASFEYSGICLGDATTFTNTTASGQEFTWDFGDGTTLQSNDASVSHTYTAAGVYGVSLIVNNNGKTNTKYQEISIKEQPIAEFEYAPSTVLTEIKFEATQVNGATYAWQIDGEDVATGRTFTHTFDMVGTYEVTLTVTVASDHGDCVATITKQVVITEKPSAPVVLTDNIGLGYRPVGAWKRPYEVAITPDGSTPLTITSAYITYEFDDNYFLLLSPEITEPVVLQPGEVFNMQITHDVSSEYYLDFMSEGDDPMPEPYYLNIESEGNETTQIYIEPQIYIPVEGDVYELATVVEEDSEYYPADNGGIYSNYLIPGMDMSDEYAYFDAVYQVTYEENVNLKVTVNGENGRAYIYNEDFYGEGGPGLTNYIGYKEEPAAHAFQGFTFDFEDGGQGVTWETGSLDNTGQNMQLDMDWDTPHNHFIYSYQANNAETEQNYFITKDKYYLTETSRLSLNVWKSESNMGYKVFVTENGIDMTYVSEGVVSSTDVTNVVDVDLSQYAGGYYYIGVMHYGAETATGYGNIYFDNITLYEAARATREEAANVLEVMLEPGTYYVVAADYTPDFSVTFETVSPLPFPERSTSPMPEDLEKDIATTTEYLQWTLGDYTGEYQLLFGTAQPFTDNDILIDWTEKETEQVAVEMPALENNMVYYWQVNARNYTGETQGAVWKFATPFDAPQNLAVTPSEINVGETAAAIWDAVTPSALVGYNVWADRILLTAEPVTDLTYAISGLDYKAEAYDIKVEAVYNIDGFRVTSSSETAPLLVKGEGVVFGYVYDSYDNSPVEDATVTFGSIDFTTDADGYYEGTVFAGDYEAAAAHPEFNKCTEHVSVAYNGRTQKDFTLDLVMTMAENVVATETTIDETVDVEWDFISTKGAMYDDFESGDLATYQWTTSADYPWTVVDITGGPEETVNTSMFGTKCAKSGNYAQANTTSWLELTAFIPFDGKMSFYYRISCEPYGNADQGMFYLDGQPHIFDQDIYDYYLENGYGEQYGCFGTTKWQDGFVEIDVTAGTHTFRWEYVQDGSSYVTTEDAYYIDNVKFYDNANVFNVYVKDVLADDAEPVLLQENHAEKAYTDNTWWAAAEDGIYQYGVSVEYNEDGESVLGENFDSGQFSEGWTVYSDPSMKYTAWDIVDGYVTSITTGEEQLCYLVTPSVTIDVKSTLQFDYKAEEWPDYPTDFNKIGVGYSTSATGPWTMLKDYNDAPVNDWEHVSVEILVQDEPIYIAFIHQNVINYGMSPCIDNIVLQKQAIQGESRIAWSNMIAKGNHFITDGNWNEDANWSRTHVVTAQEVAVIDAAAELAKTSTVKALLVDNGTLEITEAGVLNANDAFNDDAATLTINAGGQLVHANEGVMATFVKNIEAYTGENDGWYTISSPLAANVNASDVTNLLSGEFDLYRYDEPTHYWENYEDANDVEPGNPDNTDWDNNNAVIEQGRGYLYANAADQELSFVGELNVTAVDRVLSAASDKLTGFNLLGNPFAHDIYKGVAFAKGEELREGYYTLNYHGAWQPLTDADAIKSGAGFLVQTDNDGTTINIDKTNAATRKANDAMLAVSVVNSRYEDVAYVSFKDGLGLEKIGHMNEYIPMVYVPGTFNNFAIATMEEDVTEIPVNFEAMTMGEYTIAVKAKDCEYKTMILVDKFTGNETNLLVDSYTFMATTTDDPDRFLIKLSEDAEIEDSFIYISNGELVFDNLSSDAIINVFDVLGRNVATFNNCGDTTYRVSTDLFADGVYLVRLIEGNNVKVQKMVIE